MHVNKVSHVKTIDLVARELGEDVDTLHDVSLGMEPEDGLIWVHGLDDDGVLAFTEFGVESLVELLQIHREQGNPPVRAEDSGRMWQTISYDRIHCFDKGQAAMEAEPFAGMPMPLKVEALAADPVETREWRVKLVAEVLGKAGPIALNEAIACSVPFAADVDRIVELGRPDSR